VYHSLQAYFGRPIIVTNMLKISGLYTVAREEIAQYVFTRAAHSYDAKVCYRGRSQSLWRGDMTVQLFQTILN